MKKKWEYFEPKFEYKKYLKPHDSPWTGHEYFIYDFIRNIKPKRVVELGTHKGTSFFSMCQTVKDGNLKTKLSAVDTWVGDKQAGFYGKDVFEKVKKIKKEFYSSLDTDLLKKTFDEALLDFKDESIDLLHIDGLHTYEAVKHDFKSWLSKVNKNGVILLHDTHETTADFGVYILWDEIKKDFPTIDFVHSHGLGVMFKGKDNAKTSMTFKEIWEKYYKTIYENKTLESANSDLSKERNAFSISFKNAEKVIIKKDGEIEKLNKNIKQKDQEIISMRNSKFWKLRIFYVRFGPRRVVRVLKRDGLFMFIKKLGYLIYFKGHIPQQYPEYQKWIKINEKYNTNKTKEDIRNFKYKPKISVIVPVYNVEPKWLDRCIGSVRNQYYENWELCLYDDASTKKETIDCLKEWQKKGDKRIKVGFGKKNQHISGASNEALKMATGEFVALLDNDDELAPFALYENVKLLNKHKDADFIYSDEDKIDKHQKRRDPFFKPDWSPELMLSQMYTCHLGLYRKSIIDKIGGFRKGYEGAQDYDLVLRFIEKTKPENIYHIPKVLYHWRTLETSTATGASAKDYAHKAAKKAIQDYLAGSYIEGEVLDGPVSGTHRVKYEISENPLVSIIIPFRDKVEVLKKCVESILEKTEYDNYEIILVDNQSGKKETKEYLKEIESSSRIKILKYNKPFCYSAINNYAVEKANGEYVLLLNNDIEVITGEWLSAMLEQAQKEGVGAVGAKLLFPNERIQHAGIILGTGIAGHAFKGFFDGDPNYFMHADIIKNYSGVTAACLLTRKDIYEKLGGLDEKNLKIAYNDVDFCLRLSKDGYRIVYTPYAKLYHYESFSRGYDHELEKTNPKEYKRVIQEMDYMENKWGKYIENDPYYSPNLTREHENFGINTAFKE